MRSEFNQYYCLYHATYVRLISRELIDVFLRDYLQCVKYDGIGNNFISPMFVVFSICDISDNFITSAYYLRDCLGFGELRCINLTDTSHRGVLISLVCRDNDVSICYNPRLWHVVRDWLIHGNQLKKWVAGKEPKRKIKIDFLAVWNTTAKAALTLSVLDMFHIILCILRDLIDSFRSQQIRIYNILDHAVSLSFQLMNANSLVLTSWQLLDIC